MHSPPTQLSLQQLLLLLQDCPDAFLHWPAKGAVEQQISVF